MKRMTKTLLIIVSMIVLSGCNDIKEAISGIDSAAKTAATATNSDIHAIQTIQISYKKQYFTINELFTTLLRDVTWQYEKKEGISKVQIKGTWKKGLFDDYVFDKSLQSQLLEYGDVIVNLEIKNQQILDDRTKVQLIHNKNTLVNESGKQALTNLCETYVTK